MSLVYNVLGIFAHFFEYDAPAIKPLFVVFIHGVDDPTFDVIALHQLKCERRLSRKLITHFGIAAGNDLNPAQDKVLSIAWYLCDRPLRKAEFLRLWIRSTALFQSGAIRV